MAQWHVWKKCVNREQHVQKTEPNETRKEGLKSYADMTIYAMCHHKLTTFDTSFSLWWLNYMQLAHARPTMSCIHLVSYTSNVMFGYSIPNMFLAEVPSGVRMATS